MRVIVVGRSDSVRTVQHVAFLAAEGWQVRLIDISADGGDPAASAAVRVIVRRSSQGTPERMIDASRRAVSHGSRRVRLALARTSFPIAGVMHSLTDGYAGLHLGVRLRRPTPFSGDTAMLGRGALPEGDIAWLAKQVAKHAPQVVASVDSAGSAPLVDAALRALGGTRVAHVVVRDLDAASGNAATRSPDLFPTVCGVLDERSPGTGQPDQHLVNAIPVARVATLSGGWPLRTVGHVWRSRRLRVAIDCQPGEDALTFAVLRGVELAADMLRQGAVEVIGASADVQLASRLIAARTGLDLTTLDRYPRRPITEPPTCTLAITGGTVIPTALVECMVAGGVPIGTAGSMRGWIRDDENGLAVLAEDPDAVADALGRVADDGPLRQRVADANTSLSAGWLARDVAAPAILSLYEAAVRRAEKR